MLLAGNSGNFMNYYVFSLVFVFMGNLQGKIFCAGILLLAVTSDSMRAEAHKYIVE